MEWKKIMAKAGYESFCRWENELPKQLPSCSNSKENPNARLFVFSAQMGKKMLANTWFRALFSEQQSFIILQDLCGCFRRCSQRSLPMKENEIHAHIERQLPKPFARSHWKEPFSKAFARPDFLINCSKVRNKLIHLSQTNNYMRPQKSRNDPDAKQQCSKMAEDW